MDNPGHHRLLFQVIDDGLGVAAMLAHAQRKCLEALQEQEGVEWAHGGTQVAQHGDARLDDIGDGPQRLHRLGPYSAVVAGVRRVQQWKALGMLFPIEIPAIDQQAADRGAMPADIFGRRIHNDRCAMLERPAQNRCGRIVHNQRHPQLATDIRNFLDGEYLQLRIGQGLGVIGPGLGVGCLGKGLGIGGIDETGLDALILQGVGKEVPGAAVQIS